MVKTISFEKLEKIHSMAPGFLFMSFLAIMNNLKIDEDYISAVNPDFIKPDPDDVELTLSGYVLLSAMIPGHEDAKRETIKFLTEEKNSSPYDIIREQLCILESADRRYKVKKPKTVIEEVYEVEPVFNSEEFFSDTAIKSKKKIADEIKDCIKDPDADEWIRQVVNTTRKIVKDQNLTIGNVHVISSIYRKMNREYGFVSKQAKKELMRKYDLTNEPSTLRCVAEDPIYKEIFSSILNDILVDGYDKVMNGTKVTNS